MTKKLTSKNGSKALTRLKELYEFMSQHELETLELNEAGSHVRLVRRGQAPVPVPVMTSGATPVGAPAPTQAAAPADGVMIKAPMMGIFYRAPTPSSPPYVKEGEVIKPGQIICMVEAMKVFNEIKADFGGTILKMLVENGKPVKSGQDLFIIRRS